MNLDDLSAFVHTIEAKGMTGAGRRLGISKSVVSRRLARLENALSAKLVHRTTRGLSLTEAGAAFKSHAERILAELDAGRDAVRTDRATISGTLRITASMSFGVAHLAPALAELALRHPALRIHTSYTDRVVDIVEQRFDAAVRLGLLPDSTLIAKRIAPMRSMMVASPGYLRDAVPILTAADLSRHPAVVLGGEIWRFRHRNRETTVSPRPQLVADSGHALLAAVIAGVGVARLPTFLCGQAVADGRLTALLPDYEIPDAGLFIVRPPPASHVPAKVRLLTEFMTERFGGVPPWDQLHSGPA